MIAVLSITKIAMIFTRFPAHCLSPFSLSLLAFSFLRFMLRLNLEILRISARNCFMIFRTDLLVILPVIENSNGSYPADQRSLLYVHSPFVRWAVCTLARGTNSPSSVCRNSGPIIPLQSCGGICFHHCNSTHNERHARQCNAVTPKLVLCGV